MSHDPILPALRYLCAGISRRRVYVWVTPFPLKFALKVTHPL